MRKNGTDLGWRLTAGSDLPPVPGGADGATVGVLELRKFGALRRRIGHHLASRIVAAVADRVRDGLPQCELGRLGRTSLEFVFASDSVDEAESALQHLARELEATIPVDEYEFDLKVAIGAINAGRTPITEEHLDAASTALAVAQDQGRQVVMFGEDEPIGGGVEELAIFRDLRRAIRKGELQLHYQPKLNCRTSKVESAEALLRWQHPELGPIRTDRIIEIAEATGAIRDLTEWTIGRIVEDQRRIASAGHPIALYLNISGALLADGAFIEWTLAKLQHAPEAFGLEITETAVIEEPAAAIAHLKRVADAGIKIAIDDYGSGLSSLAYLKQLPAHELKIDRMFVSGLTESHRDPLLVRSSIDLAHALEMQVTAEGVEDPIALALLKVMGCDLVQGFLISRPLSPDALLDYLAQGGHLEPGGADAAELRRQHLSALIGQAE